MQIIWCLGKLSLRRTASNKTRLYRLRYKWIGTFGPHFQIDSLTISSPHLEPDPPGVCLIQPGVVGGSTRRPAAYPRCLRPLLPAPTRPPPPPARVSGPDPLPDTAHNPHDGSWAICRPHLTLSSGRPPLPDPGPTHQLTAPSLWRLPPRPGGGPAGSPETTGGLPGQIRTCGPRALLTAGQGGFAFLRFVI